MPTFLQKIYLYNTLTRKKELFIPLSPEKEIGLYLCGPTVYDFAHIGNARNVVMFDVLVRFLRRLYPKVTYVRNITDVDDKINAAALKNGESIATLTARTTQAYHEDMAALNTSSPDHEPRATHHIEGMIQMIQTLIERGHAYAAEGHVLFSIESNPHYGRLSGRHMEDMIAGARVEIAPYKKHPGDFVLWKPSDASTPGWPSPWGFGRPGWHIECSVMSTQYLGATFDIHGGGIDLLFPHHENELAQSCCTHGPETFARHWIHNGHLTVNGEKMSKSLGNFLTVRDLTAQHPGEVLRYGLMTAHYRQPLDWTDQTPLHARQALDKFYGVLRAASIPDVPGTDEDTRVLEALADDLNIPLALSHLHDLAHQFHKTTLADTKQQIAQKLKQTGALLGILQQDPETWFQQSVAASEGPSASEIEALIEARQIARQTKNFAESDRIRSLLLDQGVLLDDSPQGTKWRRV